MYTVKQLSNLAGVSVRTLHYYDEIGLLKPSSVGKNGYRYYTDEALFRLQQILFFLEMDLGLPQIKEILEFYEPSLEVLRGLGNAYNDHPDFNATFTAMHPDLPAFLQKAVTHYVDVLEIEALERELAILEE